MKADLYFRISVIDAGLQLATHLRTYPELTAGEAVRQLRAGPVFRSSLDYESALDICHEESISIFQTSPDRAQELRQTLFEMALRLRPFWAKVSPLGRDRVKAVLSDDQAQCLRYAGLLDSSDEATWRWWDELAAHFRSGESQKLLEIGRQGELLSLEIERSVLASQGITEIPRWVSIEDNLAGYDIQSYRLAGSGTRKVFIEVKSTTGRDCQYILSRREWDVASKHPEDYFFHFWMLPDKQLLTATVLDIAQHIPADRGMGTWEQVRLHLQECTFSSAF